MVQLSHMVVGGIIFLMIFTGGMLAFDDITDKYGLTPDPLYSDSSEFDKTDDISNLSVDVSNRLDQTQLDTDNINANLGGSVTAIKASFSMIAILKAVIIGIFNILQVPAYIAAGVSAILIFVFTYSIISSLLGRRT